jgi:hypothetical protein
MENVEAQGFQKFQIEQLWTGSLCPVPPAFLFKGK